MKKFLASLLLLAACVQEGKWNVTTENDYWSGPLAKNGDRQYTNGIKIGETLKDDTGTHAYYGGQNFYTPEHKHLQDPLPDERPYAGWLYGGYDANYLRSFNVQDTFGIQLGTVGPNSLAEKTQTLVHNSLGQQVPAGWSHQIHNEPGAIGIAQRKYKTDAFSLGMLEFDTLSTGGGNLGNIMTQGYIGSQVRLGVNLKSDFGSDVIFPRVSKPYTSFRPAHFGAYVFTGPVARAVARNIFLDGNTFQDSRSVDKEVFVGELRSGIGIDYNDFRFQYTFIAMTDEYKTQKDPARFGSLSFTWNY